MCIRAPSQAATDASLHSGGGGGGALPSVRCTLLAIWPAAASAAVTDLSGALGHLASHFPAGRTDHPTGNAASAQQTRDPILV